MVECEFQERRKKQLWIEWFLFYLHEAKEILCKNTDIPSPLKEKILLS